MNKYFKKEEFVCKCGKCKNMPKELFQEVLYLSRVLKTIREVINAPIIINSGVRCQYHNKNIGGVANSQHLYGRAADIKSPNYSAAQLYNIIIAMQSKKIIYIGYIQLYKDKGFIHIDIRNHKFKHL